MTFKCKKNPNIECGLGDVFYVLVYGDTTVLYKNKSEKICYPIPVHYPSFVLSVAGKNVKPKDIFEFKNSEEMKAFENYVGTIKMEKAKIINEFKLIK